jgi:phospholipase A1
MGGLVSRYLLESNAYVERRFFPKVTSLVTLGTPHLGAPLALLAARGEIERLFLNEEQVGIIANDSRYPALYELLPPATESFIWQTEADLNLRAVSPFDPGCAEKLRLSVENLHAATRFREGIDLSRKPSTVAYFFLAGTSHPTTTHALVTGYKPGTVGVATVKRVDRKDGGDETVPAWSSMLPGVRRAIVGGSHGTIYKDSYLKQVLAELVGSPRHLAAMQAPEAQLTLAEQVLSPGCPGGLVVAFSPPKAKFEGEIQFVRTTNSEGSAIDPASVSKRIPIKFEGESIERLNLSFSSPEYVGVYRVQLTDRDSKAVGTPDNMIVQDRNDVE